MSDSVSNQMFSYFCSNIVKLDELRKICNDSLETLHKFEYINNLNKTILVKCTDYSTTLYMQRVYSLLGNSFNNSGIRF